MSLFGFLKSNNITTKSKAEKVRMVLISEGEWPHSAYNDHQMKYVMHADMNAIAKIAIEGVVDRDEEFWKMVRVAIATVSVDVSMRNKRLTSIVDKISKEIDKYSD